MGTISQRLQTLIDGTPPGDQTPLEVIITLDRKADWEKGVRLVAEAGLHITGQEEVIRALFGRASPKVIRHIAAIASVSLIEGEERASALH